MKKETVQKETHIPIYVVPKPEYKYQRESLIIGLFMFVLCWSMIIPIFLLDLWTMAYHWIYFTYFKFPKVRRSDFVQFDRYDLTKLNPLQKINCLYCEYSNGVIVYIKEVFNRTEIYSCAIKHHQARKGREYQQDFYPYERFK